MANTDVVYTVTVKDVRRKVLPELDDEFAKDLGEFDSLTALRDQVRADLEEEAQDNARRQVRIDVLKQLAERVTFELADLAGRARDRPAARGVRPPADAAERRPAAGRASTGRSSGKLSGSRPGRRWPAPWCWMRSPAARALRCRRKMSIRRSNSSPPRAGRTPAALRAQLEKEGGVARLYAGLRREKAVDLALSRARITDEPARRNR